MAVLNAKTSDPVVCPELKLGLEKESTLFIYAKSNNIWSSGSVNHLLFTRCYMFTTLS